MYAIRDMSIAVYLTRQEKITKTQKHICSLGLLFPDFKISHCTCCRYKQSHMKHKNDLHTYNNMQVC